jgi:hypothetical protein
MYSLLTRKLFVDSLIDFTIYLLDFLVRLSNLISVTAGRPASYARPLLSIMPHFRGEASRKSFPDKELWAFWGRAMPLGKGVAWILPFLGICSPK